MTPEPKLIQRLFKEHPEEAAKIADALATDTTKRFIRDSDSSLTGDGLRSQTAFERRTSDHAENDMFIIVPVGLVIVVFAIVLDLPKNIVDIILTVFGIVVFTYTIGWLPWRR